MTNRELPGSWLLDAFRKGGADPGLLCERLPRETERLLGAPERLWPDEVNLILTECELLSGDAHFGLHMIDHVDFTSYGTYGYLLLSAPTVGRLLEVAQLYYPMFYRGGELILKISKSAGMLVYRFIQSKLETPWRPSRVSFSNSAPGNLSELHRQFGENLLFDQRETCFEFEPGLLDLQISDSDPQLLSILTRHADELLHGVLGAQSFEAQVRLLILERIRDGLPKADSIARLNSMSLSAFKRRLRNKGLSYRGLRDEVVREVSQRLLRDTDLSIGAIALEVGYSEHSAFDRAFARISGMTPLEYRRSSRG